MFKKNYWAFDKIYETLFKIWKIIYNIKKLFIVFSQETFRVGLTVILGIFLVFLMHSQTGF